MKRQPRVNSMTRCSPSTQTASIQVPFGVRRARSRAELPAAHPANVWRECLSSFAALRMTGRTPLKVLSWEALSPNVCIKRGPFGKLTEERTDFALKDGILH